MYLFTRQARLNGRRTQEAIDFATQMAEYTEQLTGIPLSVWSDVYGTRVGDLVFASVVPDLTALEAAMDKVNVDGHWHELSEKSLDYLTNEGLADSLSTIVHPDPLPDTAADSRYALTVDSVCGPGQLMRGMTLGVEIARRAEQLTDRPVLFLADETNRYGGVHWVFQYRDAAEMEALGERVMSDTGFLDLINAQAPTVYSNDPAVAVRRLHRRIR